MLVGRKERTRGLAGLNRSQSTRPSFGAATLIASDEDEDAGESQSTTPSPIDTRQDRSIFEVSHPINTA